MLTIRRTLIGLFLILGFALCISVAMQAVGAISEFRVAQSLSRSNHAREALARAAVSVGEERSQAYLGLLGAYQGDRQAAELRAATDAVLDEAAADLRRVGQEDVGENLRRAVESMLRVRSTVDVGPAVSAQAVGESTAASALDEYSAVVDDLLTLRAALLAKEHPADLATGAAFRMRRYTSVFLESLMLNQALVGGLLVDTSPEKADAIWEEIQRNGERAELSYEFLVRENGTESRQLRLDLAALEVAYDTRYRPLERRLLVEREVGGAETSGEVARSSAYLLLWGSRDIERIGAELQNDLFSYSRERLDLQRDRALVAALAWSAVFVAGLVVVALGAAAVLRRVVQPLETLGLTMLSLAQGDLSKPLPHQSRQDEIGAMSDTLRVFRNNAIRRERLQKEREALHGKLQDAHRQLQLDLEAASVVQSSLLPQPAQLGGVYFSGRLRASSFISGDTYDVLRQPNGPVHFFLADVAGHGAAAALVSVASRYAVAQAILRRQSRDSLAEAMAVLNDDWPEHLPYFTMILGELRPEERRGTIVQAGHPPPFLLRRSGVVEALGLGGLPVGVLRQASYEEVSFAFEPGDRLLVYSDGLTEAEDPQGRQFTEEYLAEFARKHVALGTEEFLARLTEAVQNWRQAETMDDDMTALVLEAVLPDATDRPQST